MLRYILDMIYVAYMQQYPHSSHWIHPAVLVALQGKRGKKGKPTTFSVVVPYLLVLTALSPPGKGRKE